MRRGTLIAFGLTAGTALLLYSQRRTSNVSHPSGSPEAVKREFDALIGSGTSSLSYAHPEQVNIEQLYTLAVSLDALGMSALATQARDTAVRLTTSRASSAGGTAPTDTPPQIARAREILAKLKRDVAAVTQDEVNEARGLVPLLRAGSYGYEADSIETLLELRDRILIGLPGPITPGTNP